MSLKKDIIGAEVQIGSNEAQKSLTDLAQKTATLANENDRLRISQAKLKALGKDSEEEYKKVTAAITENNKSIKENKAQMDALRKTIGLTEMSFPQLRKRAAELRKELLDMGDSADPAQFNKLNSELIDTERQMGKLKGRVGETKQAMNPLIEGAKGLLPAFGFAAIVAGAKWMATKIIESTAALSDEWEFIMKGMSTGADFFFQTLATGDWSNFTTRMNEAIEAGYKYASMLDKIQDQTRALSMIESDAADEAINLEIKLRNKLLTKDERIKAGQARIDLESKLVKERQFIASEDYNNEVNEAMRKTQLSEAQLVSVAKDINSQKRLDAEAYNNKLNAFNAAKALQENINKNNTYLPSSQLKQLNDGLGLKAELDATTTDIKEYARLLNSYDILNDDSQAKFVASYVKKNEAAVSGKENIKKIISQVNSLLAGEEENGQKLDDKAAKDQKDASDKAIQILDKANNERLSKLTDRYVNEGMSEEKFRAEQLAAEQAYLVMKKALLEQYGQSTVDIDNQINQKRIEAQKTANDEFAKSMADLAKEKEAIDAQNQQTDNAAIAALIERTNAAVKIMKDAEEKEKDALKKRQDQYLQFAESAGKTFADLMNDNEATMADYLKATLVMALDAFHEFFMIEKAKTIISGMGKGPVGIALAIAKVVAMETAYQLVRGALTKKSGSKQSGGFAETAASDSTPVGTYHANEFIGSAPSARNPSIRQVYNIIDLAQKQGSVATLNLPAVMASMGMLPNGRQSGGFAASSHPELVSGSNQIIQSPRDPELTAAINMNSKAIALLMKNGVQFPIVPFKKDLDEISDLINQTGMGGFKK